MPVPVGCVLVAARCLGGLACRRDRVDGRDRYHEFRDVAELLLHHGDVGLLDGIPLLLHGNLLLHASHATVGVLLRFQERDLVVFRD